MFASNKQSGKWKVNTGYWMLFGVGNKALRFLQAQGYHFIFMLMTQVNCRRRLRTDPSIPRRTLAIKLL